MVQDDAIVVNISYDLDPEVYNVPITLKTYVPRAWKATVLNKKNEQETQLRLKIQKDALGPYVLYSLMPGEDEIILAESIDI